MTILLIVLLFLVALGAASALGWTVDSRDSAYGLAPVRAPRTHRRTGRRTGR